jgi:hypothetical protein
MLGGRWIWVVVVALAIKALFVAVLLAAAGREAPDLAHIGLREPGAPVWVWQLARGWDSHAYQRIAAHGYENTFSHSFPPGYPLLIRAARPLVGTTQAAALLVSNACAVLALLVFLGIARRYAAVDGGSAAGGAAGAGGAIAPGGVVLATMLFACLPGVMAYGTVAYSEAPFVLVTLLAWAAWLAAERGGAGAPRSLGWLALASWLFAAGVLVRHLAIPVFLGLLLLEGRRVLRARGPGRGRALREAACALSGGLGAAAWMVYAERVLHYSDALEQHFAMRFSLLGGLPSLLALGTAPEYIVQAALCVPLAVALLVSLARVDRRLALLTGLMLALSLSSTGVAALSTGRFVWTLWPLALAGLRVRDRALGWALCAVLLLWSVQAGIGHVLGTSML